MKKPLTRQRNILHQLARPPRGVARGADQQRIGLRQQRQPGGILVAKGGDDGAAPVLAQRRAQVVLPPALGSMAIFLLMALILAFKPKGLFPVHG